MAERVTRQQLETLIAQANKMLYGKSNYPDAGRFALHTTNHGYGLKRLWKDYTPEWITTNSLPAHQCHREFSMYLSGLRTGLQITKEESK